jgi:PhzF family phenazine biosynthesis protein
MAIQGGDQVHERWMAFGTGSDDGNAAAVFWLDPLPSAARLQELAKEADLPVSAFLLNTVPVQVRFFTRTAELPFCGHGALAVGASLMNRTGQSTASFQAASQSAQVQRRGELAVLVADQAWVKPEVPEPDELFAALGATPQQVRRARVASIGSPKAVVELHEAHILTSLAPNAEALITWSRANQVNGAYVVATDPEGGLLARAFNPLGGTFEDAATGVAAGALVWAIEKPFGEWQRILQIPSGASPCELHARRVGPQKTEVGGRVVRALP